MKKLFLAASLCALAAPAYAQTAAPAAAAAADASPWISMTTEDGDEIEMFINKPKNTDFTDFSGSLHGNSSSTDDINASAGVNVTTGNGQSNIKPDGTLLSTLTFDPVNNNLLDGFFASVQLDFNGPQNQKPDAGTFWIDVNGGSTVKGGATFAFSNKIDGNVHDNGFDEPLGGLGGLITSVTMRSDTANNIYFKEVKQIDWSPCGVGGCPVVGTTGSPAPETSTWVMMGGGFALMGLLGWRKARIPRYAV